MPRSTTPAPYRRRLAAAALGLGLVGGTTLAAPAGANPTPQPPITAADGETTTYEDGRYFVILKEAPSAVEEAAVTVPGAAPKAKFDADHPRVKNYEAKLKRQQERLARAQGVTPKLTFQRAINAFVADLTAEEAARIAKDPSVYAVAPDEQVSKDYTSTDFLGLPGKKGTWKTTYGGEKNAGKGVVVGVIDSGINPDNPFIDAAPVQPLKGKPKVGVPYRNADGTISVLKADGTTATAECQTGPDFPASSCDTKLIGAYAFSQDFERYVPIDQRAPHERISPLGVDSHGTHVATTIVGNTGVTQSIGGEDFGVGAGVAPAANLISYKVCWEDTDPDTGGCYTSSSVAAVEQAIVNNVDVINYSISGNNTSVVDPVALAFRAAAEAGIFVAASAGNSGPAANTVNHSSPWVTTVAAETFSNAFTGTVEFSDGTKVRGASSTRTGAGPAEVVHATEVAAAGASTEDARLCLPGALSDAAAGRIVLCERGKNARVEKSATVAEAGGVGMILVNTTEGSLDADSHSVPTVHTSDASIIQKVKSSDLTATIVPGDTTGLPEEPLPQLAGFSSRGPSNAVNQEFLKPDVAAPGVNVIAGVSPLDPDYQGETFGLMSGTSMASPNLAGMAALLAGKHTDWSPMTIKSALMTTAGTVYNGDGSPNTDNFAKGAGSADPKAAARPGLVYESGTDQWNALLTGDIAGREVNVPSVVIPDVLGTATVTRTVTALENGRWTFSADIPGFEVTASPSMLDLKKGQSAEVTLTLTRTDAPINEWRHGSFSWSTAKGKAVPTVTSPLTLRAKAAVAQDAVQGTGASGSAPVAIQPGFTGQLSPSVLGLNKVEKRAVTLEPGKSQTSLVTVGAGVESVTFGVDSGGDEADWDLLVLTPSGKRLVSATEATDESVTIANPEPGTYIVLAQLYANPAGADTASLETLQLRSGVGNLTVSPDPVPMTYGQETSATVNWEGLTSGAWRGQVQWADGVATEVEVQVP
ncbi:S8 family serine peptidase [Micrococcus sp.]|uniref:S8 family serine peptidase n=1 Tax=Micrococcus sp. TaxID=1271 RepID=UPI002A90F3BA|nr:S8 family serine peptidase [Micrococcus sp.]MDY6055878.1 S8 family serine peptidase [Micrococcus sp.]